MFTVSCLHVCHVNSPLLFAVLYSHVMYSSYVCVAINTSSITLSSFYWNNLVATACLAYLLQAASQAVKGCGCSLFLSIAHMLNLTPFTVIIALLSLYTIFAAYWCNRKDPKLDRLCFPIYEDFIGSHFLTRMARSVFYSSWLRLTYMELCSDGVQASSTMALQVNFVGLKGLFMESFYWSVEPYFFIPCPTPSWQHQLHDCNWWSLANQCLCVYAITLTLALVVRPSLALTLSSARLRVQCSSSLFQNACCHFSQHHSADAV